MELKPNTAAPSVTPAPISPDSSGDIGADVSLAINAAADCARQIVASDAATGRKPAPNRAPLLHEILPTDRADRDIITAANAAQLETIHARTLDDLRTAGLSFADLIAFDFQNR